MNDKDVKCPVCGAFNKKLDLEETDGWMECEECHTAVQVLEFVKTRYVPVGQISECNVLIPLERK